MARGTLNNFMGSYMEMPPPPPKILSTSKIGLLRKTSCAGIPEINKIQNKEFIVPENATPRQKESELKSIAQAQPQAVN